MHALVLASLLIAAEPNVKHEEANSLFKLLVDSGIDAGGKAKFKFPKPIMPDGLDEAKQTAVIKKVIDGSYSLDEFTRDAIVAPQLLTIKELPGGAPKAPVRNVTVCFVVHGDFNKLEDDKFLDGLINANKGAGGKGGELNAADLKKRKIPVPDAKDKREGYGFVEFDFLNAVRLKATGHALWSRNSESVIAAAEIDPRFNNDEEFPNEWRSLKREGGGIKIGDPEPWNGAAMYVKITRLHEPKGAIFIEQHIIFVEPEGWFEGPNFLTAKLPLAVRDNVQSMRKEFKKK